METYLRLHSEVRRQIDLDPWVSPTERATQTCFYETKLSELRRRLVVVLGEDAVPQIPDDLEEAALLPDVLSLRNHA
ncbi:MAG: hypothetical protein ACYCOU_06500 [Sulfobacillus sp.]